MPYSQLSADREDEVAIITLVNPPVNSITMTLLSELEDALSVIDSDEAARALVITGAGEKAFSAGADFREFAGDSVREFQRRGAALFNLIEHNRKPVIAAINGSAYGGGLELALSCHLRIQVNSALLAFTEVRLGIIPGWGGTQRLPRLIGRTRALEALLTGDAINAHDALSYGLVNRVTTQAELMSEAKALGMRLARQAPLAQAAIIDCVTRGLDGTLADGLQIEAAHALELGESEDAMIGVMSLIQKEEPQFKGR
jgi:enoyl-CoA hydratase/carnithine racemase